MHKLFSGITILLILCAFFGTLTASEHAIQYLFPKPGSSLLPAGTEVLIRFQEVNPNQIANLHNFIEVVGEKSGSVSGEITILKDQKTIHFLPDLPFV
ncbi:hypothetical protein HQ585_18675, partial [candidate division KSB1 bacterium]|nr:hypothetical protein [candidate division KSB1 bacterium]